MTSKRLQIYILTIITFIILIIGCKRGEKIPLKDIDVSIEVQRFDKDLFALNQQNGDSSINELATKYGDFFHLFTEGVIKIGKSSETEFSSYLFKFINDQMVSKTYQDVQRTFPETHNLNAELTDAFKRYRYYFPTKQIPKVYGFVSGFNNSVVIADSMLGVGLDRYLGRDCEYYPRLGIPKYLQNNMHPKKIPSDLIWAWASSEFQYNDSIDNIISNIIYEGMLMYVTKKLLPHQPDSLIFGFTSEQMKWCKANEADMWAYLVENKLLFSTESFTIKQFVGNAPFTKGFPPQSPGKAVVWLGYRIVSSFMDKNKDYTLETLITLKDYQDILVRARYNP